MALEKHINARIPQKIDSELNWDKAINFIPMKGEIIVYSKDENYSYDRIKIGDGIKKVKELPFINLQSDWNQTDDTQKDFIKNKPEEATDEEIMDVLIEVGILPALVDADGAIYTDDSNNILLI